MPAIFSFGKSKKEIAGMTGSHMLIKSVVEVFQFVKQGQRFARR